MTYLIRRQKRGKAHIATVGRLGEMTGATVCGIPGGFDLSSNVPGRRDVCKHCLRALHEHQQAAISEGPA